MRTFEIVWKYRDESRHNYALIKGWSEADALNKFQASDLEQVIDISMC